MPQPLVSKPTDAMKMGARREDRRALLLRLLGLLTGGAALALPTPTLAANDGGSDEASPLPLEIFQQSEDRLFRIGYRLATANAPFCDQAISVSGLLIHDADSYGDPDAVRRTFRLSADVAAQAVAPDSPAAKAGIQQNDTILAIAGQAIAHDWPRTEPRWERLFALRDTIDAALSRGAVEVSWQRDEAPAETAQIVGVPACPTRFELVVSDKGAAADGNRVLVGENFPGLAYDEAALAAAIAHEMAHNILRHPQTFRETGWKRKLVRLSERDADRLMPWLLYNAGYDPRAAVRFMQTWGPRHGGWIFRKRTHDGWDERVEFIEAELAKVAEAALSREDGLADWSVHFSGELETALPED